MRLILAFFIVLCLSGCAEAKPASRSEAAIAKWTPRLTKDLREKEAALGSPVFLRITKTQSRTDKRGYLEAFVQTADGDYEFFKRWEICYYSGELGPKKKQGDRQSPEGFYFVTPGRMNPNSRYHLSFNLGYPNAFDRAHSRTGDYLMVHGKCVSIGCYAMTDAGVEQIYALMSAAQKSGQGVIRVHVFPFPMTTQNMQDFADNPNAPLWKNLKQGWDWFEERRVPPNVNVAGKRYVFEALE